jgi:hypothetical protein
VHKHESSDPLRRERLSFTAKSMTILRRSIPLPSLEDLDIARWIDGSLGRTPG